MFLKVKLGQAIFLNVIKFFYKGLSKMEQIREIVHYKIPS